LEKGSPEWMVKMENKSRTRVVFLGTGNPNPDPFRLGPSLAIIVNEVPYIVDFGVGLVRSAANLTPQFGGTVPELEAKNLSLGFLTHLHSDHVLGYPDLILTPWVMEREDPLTVYGPPGTQELTNHILLAYQEDIRYRLDGLEPISRQGYRVIVHEFCEGIIYSDDLIKVEAFLVSHGSMKNAFGFRITTPDKKIVISGDTAPCDSILEFSTGVDMLIHEVYSLKGYTQKDELWKQYHRTHHTSTKQLGELACTAKPGLVILNHTLFWGSSEKDILNEVQQEYDGDVILSSDLLVIT
jgi:ribonuclease Z